MAPLFDGDQLVLQHLVWFHGSDIVSILNHELEKMEQLLEDPAAEFPTGQPKKPRESRFAGGRVADFDYGMLVEDMRATSDRPNEVMLEFKTKWLAQSPSAPSDAIRCRNCAITLKRTEEGKTGGMVPACPLSLRLSNLRPKYRRQHELLLNPPEGLYHPLIDWLKNDLILEQLAQLQEKYDPIGPLAASATDPGFPMAMTLRDCTVFLRIDTMAQKVVATKIGDLDEKNIDAKLEYWRQTEKDLVDLGFYTKPHPGSEPCLLQL
jgi:inositol-pentakisphosphate 2-kinase